MKKILAMTGMTTILLFGCSSAEVDQLTDENDALKAEVETLKEAQTDALKKFEAEKDALQNELDQLKEALETDGTEDEPIDTEERVVQVETIEQYPMTLYKSDQLEFDERGQGRIVELYVNAEEDEDGNLLFDDGQNWLLVVKDGEETYPLYNDYLQLGEIDFHIAPIKGEPSIIMIKTAHENTNIFVYRYDESKEGFVEMPLYEENDI